MAAGLPGTSQRHGASPGLATSACPRSPCPAPGCSRPTADLDRCLRHTPSPQRDAPAAGGWGVAPGDFEGGGGPLSGLSENARRKNRRHRRLGRSLRAGCLAQVVVPCRGSAATSRTTARPRRRTRCGRLSRRRGLAREPGTPQSRSRCARCRLSRVLASRAQAFKNRRTVRAGGVRTAGRERGPPTPSAGAHRARPALGRAGRQAVHRRRRPTRARGRAGPRPYGKPLRFRRVEGEGSCGSAGRRGAVQKPTAFRIPCGTVPPVLDGDPPP